MEETKTNVNSVPEKVRRMRESHTAAYRAADPEEGGSVDQKGQAHGPRA